VDPALPPVRIPGTVLHELFRHALETLPEECCGLVVGNEVERYRRAYHCRNEMTARHLRDPQHYPRDGQTAYYMNEHDYLKVCDEAETSGQRVTAVYHSHVGAGSYLSEMDLEYAENDLFPFPGADQIVIPVFERRVGEAAVFRLREGRFVGFPVERVET